MRVGGLNLRESLRGLGSYPLRAALTALGIVIGVAAFVAVLSVGEGARQRLVERIQSLGGNLLLVTPGSARSGPVRLGQGSHQTLTLQDAEAIEREIPGLSAVAPSLFKRMQAVRGNRNWSTTVQGITPAYLKAREWGVASGRPPSETDMTIGAKVALLGDTVAQRLFEGQPAVGKVIRVAGTPFTVIGVLAAKGQSSAGSDQDDKLMVPLPVAQSRLLGSVTRKGGLGYIMIKVNGSDQLGPVESQLRSLLRQRHRLPAEAADDFTIKNLAEVQAQKEEASKILTFWLAAVASVALAVGAISITNIMLVAVTERTREVGLRRAVGALRRDILWQFLSEALLLALFGGIIGVALGILLAHGITAYGDLPTVIDAGGLLLALGAASVAGVVAGVLPAVKAARLSPIEALRSE